MYEMSNVDFHIHHYTSAVTQLAIVMAHLEFSIGKNETENFRHFIDKVFLWKIIWSFQHYWYFGAPLLLSRTSSAVSPTGNSHSPLIVQFRKKTDCSAQTRTEIGHLRRPPGVELIPCRWKPLRRTRTLRDPAQTQVWSEQVWLDTTFISQGSGSWGKLAVETWRVKTKSIIITILHIIITTTSILNLRLKQLR